MADSLQVKLGADTSEFKGKLADAAASVNKTLGSEAGASSGEKFAEAFSHRVIGSRHLAGALATALGLNFEKIGENITRKITGVTKEEEENLKELGRTSDEVTKLTIERMQSTLSMQDKYNLLLVQTDQLQKKLASNAGVTTKDQLEANLLKIELAQKEIELEKTGAEISKKRYEEQTWLIKRLDEIKEQDAQKEEQRWEKRASAAKTQQGLEEKLKDLKFEALTPEKQLAQLLIEQNGLVVQIAYNKKQGLGYTKEEIELEEKKAQIIKLQAEAAKKEAVEAGNARAKKMSDEASAGDFRGNNGAAMLLGGFRRYTAGAGFASIGIAPNQQSYDKGLRDSALRDTQNEIDRLQGIIADYMANGSGLGKYETPALQDRIKALQGRKTHIQDYVFNPNYKDAAGPGIFAQQVTTLGDPLGLQRRSTDYLQNISTKLDSVDKRLQMAGFTPTGLSKNGSF